MARGLPDEVAADGNVLSPRVERSRAAILAAVEIMVDTVGVRRLRIEDVAVQAGVSRQTITNHFGTKDELVRTWLEIEYRRLAELFLAVAAQETDVAAGLSSAAEEVLSFLRQRGSLRDPLRRDMVAYMAEAGSTFPDLFSEVLAEGLTGLTGSDEERALQAGQVCYRLLESFATKPTDQLSVEAQAAALGAAVGAILDPGG